MRPVIQKGQSVDFKFINWGPVQGFCGNYGGKGIQDEIMENTQTDTQMQKMGLIGFVLIGFGTHIRQTEIIVDEAHWWQMYSASMNSKLGPAMGGEQITDKGH